MPPFNPIRQTETQRGQLFDLTLNKSGCDREDSNLFASESGSAGANGFPVHSGISFVSRHGRSSRRYLFSVKRSASDESVAGAHNMRFEGIVLTPVARIYSVVRVSQTSLAAQAIRSGPPVSTRGV